MAVPSPSKVAANALRPIAAIPYGRIARDWDQLRADEVLAIWKLARVLNGLPTSRPEK